MCVRAWGGGGGRSEGFRGGLETVTTDIDFSPLKRQRKQQRNKLRRAGQGFGRGTLLASGLATNTGDTQPNAQEPHEPSRATAGESVCAVLTGISFNAFRRHNSKKSVPAIEHQVTTSSGETPPKTQNACTTGLCFPWSFFAVDGTGGGAKTAVTGRKLDAPNATTVALAAVGLSRLLA